LALKAVFGQEFIANPAADGVKARLGQEPGEQIVKVVPRMFHVDHLPA
jgi:hypothetical protein